MQLVETHIAEEQKKPIRFQEYGVGIFKTIPTKSGIKKAIKKKFIFIDGVLATTSKYIFGGEKIELFNADNQPGIKELKLNLKILFEDDYLAIIFKPVGILVSGNKLVTIANGLTHNLKKSKQPDAVKPQPIHRLDYPTSGVLLIGKTSSAIRNLSQLFEKKEIQKTYIAISVGRMEKTGEIKDLIDEKEAFTAFEVLRTVTSERFEFLNLVKLKPTTGRKHQLRKQLYAVGCPIYGDQKYKFSNTDKAINKNLMLHSYQIKFMINDKKYTYTALLPDYFKKLLKTKRLRFPNS